MISDLIPEVKRSICKLNPVITIIYSHLKWGYLKVVMAIERTHVKMYSLFAKITIFTHAFAWMGCLILRADRAISCENIGVCLRGEVVKRKGWMTQLNNHLFREAFSYWLSHWPAANFWVTSIGDYITWTQVPQEMFASRNPLSLLGVWLNFFYWRDLYIWRS